ncbi:MAG TPA: YhdP family protein [Gallionella sp.]|nr:YhdP family protein [Gallionella sp.]
MSLLTRLTVIISTALAVLIAIAIILLRYWLLPDIEQYHDLITSSFSEAIGNTVTIGKIEGEWQGLHPRLDLSDVRILDDQGQPALVLNRVDSSVSWVSLFSAELRLASLEIDRPELLIRRDSQGEIFIGNVALSKKGGNNNLADWLLHQAHMVVRGALIVWVDEQRDAAPLVLRQVNLHIVNSTIQHRFTLRALSPEDLATPLDVRGDFYGASFDDMGKWHGQFFTQLEFTDVTTWWHWLDLPKEFSRGRGAVRSWLNVDAGRLKEITADLALYNVAARLAEDAPEMLLSSLHGRARWKDVAGGFDVSAKKLAMRMQDGAEMQPADIYVRITKAINNQPAAGEVRADLLQMEWLARLASYLPLEAGQRAQLEAYSPRGRVTNLNAQWQGKLEKPESYKIKGQFEDIALRQVGAMPGFSGLSLDVDGSDTSGKLNINSRRLVVNAPGVMREPLSFTLLIGQAGWQREQNNELKVTLDNASVVNDDLAGGLYGSYQSHAGTLGVLDLNASLTRGDVRQAARYTPLIALNKEGNDWLSSALLAGHTEDLRIRIKGNLSDFPLNGTNNSLLEIGGHVRDVVLEFDKKWPRIENIAGEFSIRGKRLEVKLPSATMLGAALRNVTVALPDMKGDDLPLEINGEAAAENSTFLQFIQQSPVRGYTDGFTDGMRISGNGHLDLFAHIPLLGDKPVKVSGVFRVQDSEIHLGKGVPLLHKTRGEISFTESGMRTKNMSAEILGGAASLNVQTVENGAVHATVRGESTVDALRKFNPHPLLNYLQGSAAWNADIVVAKKSTQLAIDSSLQGVSSSLPQPFTKGADEAMPLRMEKRDIADGQDTITVQLGSQLNARLERRDKNGAMAIKRGTVIFGGMDKLADFSKTKKHPSRAKPQSIPLRSKNGIWLAGSLPELSIQGWDSLISGTTKTGPALPIAGIDLHIEKLTGYGHFIKSLQIDASRRGDGLTVKLASDALNGEINWLPRGYEKGSKFSAHLRNLYLVKDEQLEVSSAPAKTNVPASPAKTGQADTPYPNKLPALEVVIENLQVKDKQFGRFELVGHPDGKDWRLRRLYITNPDGSLAGDGVWSSAQENTQTQLNLQLKLSDVGKTLARYSYPNTVRGGSGKLAANLSWAGTPDEFNYASLSGWLKLDTGKGRFLKMDPGAGKLLSILSLQALPSHITLDFTDVFSEGFQFDNINGNAVIRDGVINTQDFHMDGSAAKVTLKGSVDMNSGTQDLRVKVLPTLGDSVSLISAFAAGPAVGIGTLIVNKALGNPLDKLVSFEYNVTGTWSEPNVVKVVKEPVPYK